MVKKPVWLSRQWDSIKPWHHVSPVVQVSYCTRQMIIASLGQSWWKLTVQWWTLLWVCWSTLLALTTVTWKLWLLCIFITVSIVHQCWNQVWSPGHLGCGLSQSGWITCYVRFCFWLCGSILSHATTAQVLLWAVPTYCNHIFLSAKF